MVIECPPASWPDARQLHERRCFLLGITERWKVEQIWADEAQKREAARAATRYRPARKGASRGGKGGK